jgi:predicted lactoylglutathione lyase
MPPALKYENQLGLPIDWGGEDGGIAGISKGSCRMFLTNRGFRERRGNAAPVLVWLNLGSKGEVDDLYETWSRSRAQIVSPPESMPWKLYEFTVSDLDGNLFRVFYDFSRDTSGE